MKSISMFKFSEFGGSHACAFFELPDKMNIVFKSAECGDLFYGERCAAQIIFGGGRFCMQNILVAADTELGFIECLEVRWAEGKLGGKTADGEAA